MSADGLAERLGADPQTGKIPDTAPHHVLLLKALESGGSVSKSSNIFGTKMSYSGGSVGTYALFDLNGQLECSGNVYNYAGSVTSKDFQKHLLGYVPDPSTRSSSSAAVAARPSDAPGQQAGSRVWPLRIDGKLRVQL